MARYQFQPANFGLAFLIILSVVSFDLLSKMIIVDLVMQPPRLISLTSFLNLTLGFDSGVSFGMFSNFFTEYPALLMGVSMGIAFLLLAWASGTKSLMKAAALGLVSGGAIANIWDRIQRGAVTDFIDFHVGDWHWPAFNLADIAIALGAAGLVIASLRKQTKHAHNG
ncbi:signal peptidase II [Manganibacter manganicus]|uniref:Lipoprotein signal peptidase n=1 Tax=Manganibacter manganicus TaxID=1873176 RepID=A0A1V8RR92_9HYPH|nr:signal peptidase II [Pseudaminobacter manganicus]OQM75716.1 signal peptidase II [Pseudaminobacter manganicus]